MPLVGGVSCYKVIQILTTPVVPKLLSKLVYTLYCTVATVQNTVCTSVQYR